MKKILLILLLMSNLTHADPNEENLQSAYLAGGCYWGLEDLIRKIPGVFDTNVGFSGGHIKKCLL